MKKVITFAIAGLLAIAGGGAAFTVTADSDAQAVQETAKVYLLPGSYARNGNRVLNTIEGLTPLNETELAALHLEGNVYEAGKAGSALPTPTTTQTDNAGGAFGFNGWWTVVGATVTYMTAVPEVTETTYLYADFRAAFSQRRDPVLPDEGYEDSLNDYILIERATGEKEQVPLFISGTEVPNALGSNVFGRPVQYYNEWFKLYPGDMMSVYITSLFKSLEPTLCPLYASNQSWVTFESNPGVNNTQNWLSGGGDQLASGRDKRFECKEEHNYRIYIKFYNSGGTMTIYMQPQD